MRAKSIAPVFLLLSLGACGHAERLAYTCPVELRPGFVGADWELPCALVERNAALARRIMSQASPDFGDRLIIAITVREVESWKIEGVRAWGTTTFQGREANVRLGHSMWSLVHELGHVYLLYATGDSDHAHARWESSGQRVRDVQYQKAFEPLPASASRTSTEQQAPPNHPDQNDGEMLPD